MPLHYAIACVLVKTPRQNIRNDKAVPARIRKKLLVSGG